ncbi:MAG: M24 family metallopeptidase [Clostridiales bacterium]|nr:M24 family metallopeptidase [Clostridiales bacterium]OPZ67507.1 MAG: Metallopeptidase family M24 [Firmicutes bacterium ADurb.Bin467]
MFDSASWQRQSDIVKSVLERAPSFDKGMRLGEAEFAARHRKLIAELQRAGYDCGIVYSDEHYAGDVPYLGGNTNISIEPVAGVIGKNGFYLLAGLEGGYCAEQLAPRSGCEVRKVEMLKLADEDYPVAACRLEDVLEEACGGKPGNAALLTPSQVLPVSIYRSLVEYFGGDAGRVVDAQEIFYRIKYEKSDGEMRMTEIAAKISDVMVEAMASVLRPGLYETQVAQWGYAVALELGAEQMGFSVSVCSAANTRTLIGKAMNRRIQEGDYVLIGAAPKWDGLTACERASVVCVDRPSKLTDDQRYWFGFTEEAYRVGLEAYRKVAAENLPAYLQEKALVDYFRSKSDEVSARIGKRVDMALQKPYTGTHNGGYTECQEFYGAITMDSKEPLGRQIITMLDVAVRGFGHHWNDIVIPGMDYVLVEKTLGKYGRDVKVLNDLPINIQHFVGRGF